MTKRRTRFGSSFFLGWLVPWSLCLLAVPSTASAQDRAAWLQKARWGVMGHYLPDWIDARHQWTSQEWNQLIDAFDVEKLAAQLAEAGAGYYLISIGQNSGFYLGPNATYDRLTGIEPSKCSRRDLVRDLYQALNKRGIRLLVYLPSGAPDKDPVAMEKLQWKKGQFPNREFLLQWEQVVRDWSLRWSDQVSGWWFDGCYWPNAMYRSPQAPNFGSLAAAARAGNPNSIVAFNPGVYYPIFSLSPYQDYTAGEISDPNQWVVKERRVTGGKVDGAQLHMLSYLGEKWGLGLPRFSTKQVLEYTQRVLDHGGAVTWDVPLQRSGTISEPFMEQLRALGQAVQTAPSPENGSASALEEWGSPVITVSEAAGTWTLSGQKNTVKLDASDLAVTVRAGATTWKMVPSAANDLLVRRRGEQFNLRLTDAREIQIVPYKTGFKTGVKIILAGFRKGETDSVLDLKLFLTLCLEGSAEELVFEAMAQEGDAVVRELNWPKGIDGREVDDTVLSNDDGMLLPRHWPKPYHPIRRARQDTSIIQSNLIESWSMSWWGFQKGDAAMIVIVETPDDAAYTFSHLPGGPTSIGPTWRAQLGRFGYLRSLRMDFLSGGNYVDLCKRYRRHVMDSGLFVSLQAKMARNPLVKNLIGNPFLGARVLRNVKPRGPRYDEANPENSYQLTTFAEHIGRLRKLKAEGFDHLNVSLSGWPNLGYDRQHPDGLPPNKEGGGWQGMKAFFDACRQLGYTCWLHDQYRDFYPDAPSWDPQFAVQEEDEDTPPRHFPGTRFHPHDWKQGSIPMMNYWDGGTQAYLNNRFMLGHVQKNYRLMFEHGIRPQGSYQDVFGYIPPDEDFNPEHPSTRTDSMKSRAAVFHWVRNNLGIVGTEDAADWTIPYVDYATSRFNRNPQSGNDASSQGAIPVPLYDLVYHDAIVTTGSGLRAFLHGKAPSMRSGGDSTLDTVRRMAALHRRVGLLELVNHEFLDPARRKERTTFADGTTVTVDWDAGTVTISPRVEEN